MSGYTTGALRRIFTDMKELFDPGRIHCSSGVEAEFRGRNINPLFYFIRHFNGDWGDIEPGEMAENEHNLESGGRLFSRYQTPFGELWIITTADRSETYMCFPTQYLEWATGGQVGNTEARHRQPPNEGQSKP